MRMVFKRITLLAAWMTLAITGFADTLQLKNGRQISGTFEGGTSRIVRFRSDSGVQEYDILTLSAVLISSTSTITNVVSEKARNTPEYLIHSGRDKSASYESGSRRSRTTATCLPVWPSVTTYRPAFSASFNGTEPCRRGSRSAFNPYRLRWNSNCRPLRSGCAALFSLVT